MHNKECSSYLACIYDSHIFSRTFNCYNGISKYWYYEIKLNINGNASEDDGVRSSYTDGRSKTEVVL